MKLFNNKKKKVKKQKTGQMVKISTYKSPYRRDTTYLPKRQVKKKSKSYISKPSNRKLSNTKDHSKLKLFFTIILSLGLIFFGIYSFFLTDWFLIEDFQVEEEGTLIEDFQKLKEVKQNILDKNILLLNEEKLIKEIRKNHPEIDKITITKILPDTIKISYTKFPSTANIINIIDGIQKKFIADSQGFLIEENTEQLDLPYIYIETNSPLEVNKTFLQDSTRSKERLKYMISSINIFEEKFGIKVLYATYKQQEREVHLHTEKHFYVMIDMEKDLIKQIEKLKKSLQKLDIYQTPLVYIDLRISGKDTEKVIFKRK